MSLHIPDFPSPYLEQVAICAMIEPENATGVSDWLTERVQKVSRITVGGRPAYFGIIAERWTEGDETGPAHLHIDISLETFYRSPPKTEIVDVSEVLEITDKFQDVQLKAILDARFTLPMVELPKESIIAPFLDVEAESAGMSMRITGGQCELGPPPIRRMEWFQRNSRGRKELCVDFDGVKETHLHDRILFEVVEPVSEAFNAFILNTSPGGPTDE